MIHLALFIYLLHFVSSQNTPVPMIIEISPLVVKDVNETVDLVCKVKDLRDASILWGRQKGSHTNTLWGNNFKFVKDDRISVQFLNSVPIATSTLRIANVQTKDAGVYRCSISFEDEEISKDVTLQVRSPAVILGNTSASPVNTSLNGSATLECYGDGYPAPDVVWTREHDAVLPNGVTSYRGNVLKINNVQKEHAGNYFCTIDNKVGHARRTIRLDVEYPPIVKASKERVGQAIGYTTHLECVIESYPPVKITWFHDNMQITQNNQYYTQSQSAMKDPTRLAVLEVKVHEAKQYGRYTCEASSTVGKGSTTIELYQTEKEVCSRNCETNSGHSIINGFDLKLGFTSVIVLMFQLHHM